jgi:hypothetical protein
VLGPGHVRPLVGEQEDLDGDVVVDASTDKNALTLRPVACSTTLVNLSAICCSNRRRNVLDRLSLSALRERLLGRA